MELSASGPGWHSDLFKLINTSYEQERQGHGPLSISGPWSGLAPRWAGRGVSTVGCLGFGAWAVQGKSLPVRALLRPVPEAQGERQ